MVHIVGAGCGAADLITLRGKRLLEEADLIVRAAVAHTTGHGEKIQAGFAGRAVRLCPVERVGLIGFISKCIDK